MSMIDGLRGARVAIAEAREADLFAALLQRHGARVLRCPLVAIADAPDPAPVLAWIERFNAGCDDLILFTGEGLRRLLTCIDRHRPPLRAGFLARLASVRRLVRGPKPERALRELGLKADRLVEPATTDGLIAALQSLELTGHRVCVQLYGGEPNPPLMTALQAAGAQPDPVWPYTYAPASADPAVLALIDELTAGKLDAIAFTSAAQVERLFAVAAAAGREAGLHTALARVVVAAVGPVVTRALARRAVRIDAEPAGRPSLKPLTAALAAALANPKLFPNFP
ncbi:MAG: uroporphyrinogen-III synthase [Gammaproteobacteria bacterium]|nr:uroporphyrinogen-III synthase [Gammaproteobacteria bacterium]